MCVRGCGGGVGVWVWVGVCVGGVGVWVCLCLFLSAAEVSDLSQSQLLSSVKYETFFFG